MSVMMEALRGPWRLNPTTGQVHTAPAPGRPHGAVVASVGHHSGFAERDVIGPLVAAAPELLERAVDLIAILSDFDGDYSDPAFLWALESLAEETREAITKANAELMMLAHKEVDKANG